MARSKAVAGAALAAAAALTAGCASNQAVPTASIEQAEQRLEEAERAEAQRYANRELNMAREKLIEAREAQQDGDEERAARLAELAELDAAYAAAVADNEMAQSAVQELRDTLAALESELERQQDDSDPLNSGNVELGGPDGAAPQGLPEDDRSFGL